MICVIRAIWDFCPIVYAFTTRVEKWAARAGPRGERLQHGTPDAAKSMGKGAAFVEMDVKRVII